jgi:hypothetical protein
VHYLANTPTVAWAEWIRHQEIDDPADLEGVAAALWAVLIPDHWTDPDLQPVNLSMDLVLGTTPGPTESLSQVGWCGHAGAGFVGTAPVRWPTPLPVLI